MISTRGKSRNTVFILALCLASLAGVRPALSASVPAPSPAYTLSVLPDSAVYGDFVVGPGKIEIDLDPGQSRTVDVTVANRLGTEKSFSLTEEDFTGSNNPDQPIVLLGDDRGPYSLKDFVHIPVGTVDIPQGQKASIPVTVSVPAGAQPGGLYGSVIVSVATRQGAAAASGGLSTASNPIITRLATLLFVRVAGPVKEQGRLSGFSLSGGRTVMFGNGPLVFDLTYENSGNVHLVPRGAVTVSNMFGSALGEINVDPWFAMPQSTRFREISWNPPFLFGRYTAHAAIARGYGSTTDQADLVFWVIPWKIILAAFAGLALLIFAIRWIAAHVRIVKK